MLSGAVTASPGTTTGELTVRSEAATEKGIAGKDSSTYFGEYAGYPRPAVEAARFFLHDT